MPKTVLQILEKAWRRYEGDVDAPDFDDDDMQLFFAYLLDSLEEWMDRFPQFRELFDSLTAQSTGDKTTTPGSKLLTTPTNFVKPANFIMVGEKKLEYISPERMAISQSENDNSDWFSITGFPGSFKIVLSFTPDAVMPVSYDYYRTLNMPTEENDVVEISRPNFCAYYILSQLYLDDEFNKDLVPLYESKMNEEERRARLSLVMKPAGTGMRIRDGRAIRLGAGFGRVARGPLL